MTSLLNLITIRNYPFSKEIKKIINNNNNYNKDL